MGVPLTVLRHLQDVADQGAVPVEGLRPGEVDAALLRGAQGGQWVLWGVGKLPASHREGERERENEEKQKWMTESM